ncbi:MAG: TetR family transcriptional regulator [Actinocatenispora sp.]
MVRRGRRPGQPDTREAILDAARRIFAEVGFDGASIRRIAGEAGVDPALVHHYFGAKDQLFTAALEVPINPARLVPEVVAGGTKGFGERLVGKFLRVWDGPAGPATAALLRSALSHEWSSRLFREFLTTEILGRALGELHLPDSDLRGSLIASQLIGLAMARYIIRVEPLAGLPAAQVVALVGPTVQRYLTGDLSIVDTG